MVAVPEKVTVVAVGVAPETYTFAVKVIKSCCPTGSAAIVADELLTLVSRVSGESV
jgi:hypothetical protein